MAPAGEEARPRLEAPPSSTHVESSNKVAAEVGAQRMAERRGAASQPSPSTAAAAGGPLRLEVADDLELAWRRVIERVDMLTR